MTEKKKTTDETDAVQAATESKPLPDDVAVEAAGDEVQPADVAGRIAELEAENATLKDQALRALAEAENTRKRAERDRAEAAKYGPVGLARDLLSVADNLRRALDSLPAEARAQEENGVRNFIAGVEMIEKDLLAAFANQGIEKLEPLGELFDHATHQAMFELEDAEKPAGTVVQLLQAGYRLHDRLLRPAMVGVSKGGPKAGKLKPEEAEAAAASEADLPPTENGAG